MGNSPLGAGGLACHLHYYYAFVFRSMLEPAGADGEKIKKFTSVQKVCNFLVKNH